MNGGSAEAAGDWLPSNCGSVERIWGADGARGRVARDGGVEPDAAEGV